MALIAPLSPVIVPAICPVIGDSREMSRQTADEFRELYAESVQMFGYNPDLDGYTATEKSAIYLDHLLHMGDFERIFSYCDEFTIDELNIILNEKPECMYHGNILHSVLYLYTGEIAMILYKFFRNIGAIPCKNYYDEMPWEIRARRWTSIPSMIFERNYLEFVEIYDRIKIYEEINSGTANYERIPKNSTEYIVPCHCGYHYCESDYVTNSYSKTNDDSDTYTS